MAEGSTRQMSDEHRRIVETNKHFFAEHIVLTEEFYNLLLHCKILTDRMYKNMKAKSAGNPDREVRELVDLVPRRGDRALYWFLEVLKQTGQQSIADHLEQKLGGDMLLAPAGSGHVMSPRPPTKRPIRETGLGGGPPSRFNVQVQSPSGPSPSIRTQSRNFPNHDVLMYSEGLPWSDRSQENPPESGPGGLEDRLRYPVQARSAQENQLEPTPRERASYNDLTGATPRTSYPSEGYPRPGIPHRETVDERPRTTYPREGTPRTGIQCRESTQATNARAPISYAENSVEPSRRKLELLNLEEDDEHDEMETQRHKLYDDSDYLPPPFPSEESPFERLNLDETIRRTLDEEGIGGLKDGFIFDFSMLPSSPSEENPADQLRKNLEFLNVHEEGGEWEMNLQEGDGRETTRHKVDDHGTDRSMEFSSEIPYASNNPGILVIINIHEFSDPTQNRNGTDEDVNRLCNTFKALGFKVYVKNNLNIEDFRKFLKKFLDDRLLWDYSSVGLVFMSHGQNETIFTADLQTVPFREILEAVAKTESLRSKPKLIIFHVCRQENNLPEMNATGLEATGRELKELEETEPQMDFASCGSEHSLQPQAGGSQVVDSHLGGGAERGGRGLGNEEGGSGGRGSVNEQRGQGTVQGRELPTTDVSDVRMDGERSEGYNRRRDVRESVETVEPITKPNSGIRRKALEPQGAEALNEPEDSNAQRMHPTTVLQLGDRSHVIRADENSSVHTVIESDANKESGRFQTKRGNISRQQLTEEERFRAIFSPIIEFDTNGARLGGARPTGGSASARGPDMIIVYPTLYGMSAGRLADCPDEYSRYKGSYLITVLCKVFNEYAARDNYDIERMLRIVRKKIREYVRKISWLKQRDAGSSSGASDVGGASGIVGAGGGTPNNFLSPSSNDYVEEQIVEVVTTLENQWFLKPNMNN